MYKYIISNNKIRICSCTEKCYKKIKHIYYNTVEPVLRGHRLTETYKTGDPLQEVKWI